ncbi:zinc-binding dehydrogenase [Pseudoalteromonas sp. BDTF-M6]|uniref:zinc-binding dehydrogenase n=1 Tax=Pseudoalteromonas sp. BDTF-M6 TaxID=2796132 RepID=UPI001BAE820A|nr:zinc-binding dehydrogenase [Pseudoalteromonas sp. BDTF-M6]MBS3797890.1 zinc-binding dehydrogenase [Pseudoalteromonas sp. BDTF-M6]
MPGPTNTMQALVLNEPSPSLTLQVQELPVPHIGANEVLVEVEYVGLNHIDARLGAEGFCRWQYPHVLGLDAVGTVVEAPVGVFPKRGTRVIFTTSLAEQGVLKRYTKVANYAVAEVPASIPSAVAATLPNAGMTALAALDKIQLQAGESIYINSGCGAVAHFAIQYARKRGAKVFVSAPQSEHERIKALGADVLFASEGERLVQDIKHELGPDGFDTILNSCGGETFVADLAHLRFGGRIACLNGFAQIPQELLFSRAPIIAAVSLGGAWLANSLCAQQKLSFMGQQLLQDVGAGHIQPPAHRTLAFEVEQVSEALRQLYQQGASVRPVVAVKSGALP